jgi:ABC-2 type transport system permease protein
MIAALAKYRQAFLIGLQSNLVYRFNFATRAVFSLCSLAVVYVLWRAAYGGSATIGGFSFGQTLTYFVVLLVLQFTIGAFNEDYQISEEIRNGLINQFLLKPINYYLYRLSIFGSARLVSGAVVILPLAIAAPFLHHWLALPTGLWRIALALPAMALAALIQFTIAYCFGLMTFWFLEIQGFIILSLAVESILGGQMFPLDLLPPALFKAAQFLPFYYQMYFPAAILTGRIGGRLALQGLGIQFAWVLALLLGGQVLWQRGLRRHTAVGG